MGTKSKPRPGAQTPRVPSEPFPSQPDTALENTPCPNQITVALAEYTAGVAAAGAVVTVREVANGVLAVMNADGNAIGRLAGVRQHQRRCLLAEPYVGVVKEEGDGPRVQLERVADH